MIYSTAAFNAGAPLMRTTPITPLAKQVHAESFVDAGCNLVNRQFENDFQRVRMHTTFQVVLTCWYRLYFVVLKVE